MAALPELSAPLFIASERARHLAQRKAPYGLQASPSQCTAVACRREPGAPSMPSREETDRTDGSLFLIRWEAKASTRFSARSAVTSAIPRCRRAAATPRAPSSAARAASEVMPYTESAHLLTLLAHVTVQALSSPAASPLLLPTFPDLRQPPRRLRPTFPAQSCVSHLAGTHFGEAIDAHSAIFRINAAPTRGHEEAVGRRTTIRVHNSEKPFMLAALGVPELQIAICHMGWIGSCQHQAFSGLFEERLAYVNPAFYLQVVCKGGNGGKGSGRCSWRRTGCRQDARYLRAEQER